MLCLLQLTSPLPPPIFTPPPPILLTSELGTVNKIRGDVVFENKQWSACGMCRSNREIDFTWYCLLLQTLSRRSYLLPGERSVVSKQENRGNSSMPIVNTDSFWWRQCSIERRLPSLPSLLGFESPWAPPRRQHGVRVIGTSFFVPAGSPSRGG